MPHYFCLWGASASILSLLILYYYILIYNINYLHLDFMDNKSAPLLLSQKLKFWYQHFARGGDNFEDSLLPVADI